MIKNIELPDIGDFDEVEVIEILVNVGDTIAEEDSIITLESDKASMEIPTPFAGVVREINLNLGDKITQGSVILSLEVAQTAETPLQTPVVATPNLRVETICVPDIGDFDEVEVIEILANVGDELNAEDSIITLESDKASMEIPTPVSGKITQIHVNLGDKIKQGERILMIETLENPAEQSGESANTPKPSTAPEPAAPKASMPTPSVNQGDSHASPSIRKLARELGVELSNIGGSGKKGRITEEDLKGFVKNAMQNGGGNNTGSGIPQIPSIDFAKFGEIEEVELSRINKISGKHLSACWLNVPHVTQFDEANIDDLEAFRKSQKAKGNKLTPIVFIIKAVIHCLKKHPKFNASLSGDKLILKKYFNIGVAVNTPNGLMVPVIKDADKKSLTQLQTDLVALAGKARDGKLSPNDMSGACFTISSLGGIGGTQFTPIVNAPEVAILGVSKSQVKPIWNGKEFIPTTILPLSLSYDHRVIDGALGAEFITDLSSALSDIREVLL
jgi:pyruvate dehydrogenase E2 component (dihydrolipoamide acetyltransferase)